MRVLLLATTTGYQTRAFGDAAARLGVSLRLATDRCDVLDDPWRDRALPIRFDQEEASAAVLIEAAGREPIDGVLAVGDQPTAIAAQVAAALGLDSHSLEGVRIARHKQRTREALRSAGLAVPWFRPAPITGDAHALAATLTYPCVVKPVALSGSRGVMRVNDAAGLVAAFYRLRSLMQAPDIRKERNADHEMALVEGFIDGREYAIEGVMNHGTLHVLAVFDKPDPLDGPFFEETIYVTPSSATDALQRDIEHTTLAAARAIGLRHGPIHAECRVNGRGVFMLEVAARPIGGLCARALRFQKAGEPSLASLEELLLRHAIGQTSTGWHREPEASGVMMIPIPRRGVLRRVSGVEAARSVAHVDDIQITAKIDQLLVPLPEGASYLGFIFARAATASDVEQALREAHAQLDLVIDPEVRVLQSAHG